MNYPKLTALLTALEGGAAATQEELDAVNAEFTTNGIKTVGMFPAAFATAAADLATSQTEVTRLTGELGTATASVTKLTSDLSVANNSVLSITAENTTLKAKVAAGPAVAAPITTTTDPITEETAEQKSAKIINSLPHNQGILDNPLFQKTK